MKFTTKKLVRVLKLARDKYLWNGLTKEGKEIKVEQVNWTCIPNDKEKHVCYAVGNAVKDLYGEDVPVKLDDLISSHLWDYLSMEMFLRTKYRPSLVDKTNQSIIQTYRVAMINNMIDILEGKK